MGVFKKIDNLDMATLTSSYNPTQHIADRINENLMKNIKAVEEGKRMRELEEMRKHNELIEAIKEAKATGANIVIGDNVSGIQIQQNTNNSTQVLSSTHEFNYEKVFEILNEIKDYFDMPKFNSTFNDKSDEVKAIINQTLKMVGNKENPSLIKKSLEILKDLVIGASGSLIASGIIALLEKIPL